MPQSLETSEEHNGCSCCTCVPNTAVYRSICSPFTPPDHRFSPLLPPSLPSLSPPLSSVLFQIAHLGDNDDEPEFSSAMPLEEGETFFFAPRPLKNLIQVDEMESLSPIMAAHVRGLGGGGGGREGGRGRKEGKKGGREEGRSQ